MQMLHRVRKALKKGGRLLFQMGGRGNAHAILGILDAYLIRHPPDEEGLVHVDMVRLEVEAFKL